MSPQEGGNISDFEVIKLIALLLIGKDAAQMQVIHTRISHSLSQ